jgi:hypothetical protein
MDSTIPMRGVIRKRSKTFRDGLETFREVGHCF